MLSRYSAFVEKKVDYLNKTMKRSPFDKKSIVKGKEQWLGLTILQAYPHPTDAQTGYVEFIARYTHNNQPGKIHELSEFHFIADRWYDVGGVQNPQ